MGKSGILLTGDLQKVFGEDAAPCLRTAQLWIGAIKDGSFSIQKSVRSGSPQLVFVPVMTRKVENLIGKCPRMLLRGS